MSQIKYKINYPATATIQTGIQTGGDWSCPDCTFINLDSNGICQICGAGKPALDVSDIPAAEAKAGAGVGIADEVKAEESMNLDEINARREKDFPGRVAIIGAHPDHEDDRKRWGSNFLGISNGFPDGHPNKLDFNGISFGQHVMKNGIRDLDYVIIDQGTSYFFSQSKFNLNIGSSLFMIWLMLKKGTGRLIIDLRSARSCIFVKESHIDPRVITDLSTPESKFPVYLPKDHFGLNELIIYERAIIHGAIGSVIEKYIEVLKTHNLEVLSKLFNIVSPFITSEEAKIAAPISYSSDGYVIAIPKSLSELTSILNSTQLTWLTRLDSNREKYMK